MIEKRIEKFREILEEEKIDVAFVSDPANIYYLSDFTTGEDAKLFISKSEQILYTDGRYILQAEKESPNFEIVVPTNISSREGVLKDLLKRFQNKVIGFEGSNLKFEAVQKLRKFKYGLGIKMVDLSKKLSLFRAIKDPFELRKMREASRIAHRSLEEIKHMIKPGTKEREIALELEYRFRKNRASGTSFPTLVASGPNGAIVHHMAGDRKFEEGDMIIIDFGCRYRKYASDETQTISIGKPSNEIIKVYGIVLDAHEKVVSEARCGMSGKEIDKIARDHIEKEGYGEYFVHATGHSLGLGTYENGTFHELPALSPLYEGEITENMVVTVEPGIYLPGKGGVRIEGEYLMTEKKLERLVHFEGEK